MMQGLEITAEVVKVAQQLSALGLNVNKSGNVSCRFKREEGEGFFITPTGVAYELLEPIDIPWMPLKARLCVEDALGQYRPSSEWQMHAAVYQKASGCSGDRAHAFSLCDSARLSEFVYSLVSLYGCERWREQY